MSIPISALQQVLILQPVRTYCTPALSAAGANADARHWLAPQHTAMGSISYNTKCVVPAQYPQWRFSWLSTGSETTAATCVRVNKGRQEKARQSHHLSCPVKSSR